MSIPGIRKIQVVQHPKLDSWSYSRWEAYKDCPAKVLYKHVMKLPEEKSETLERGIFMHKMVEDYLKAPAKKRPKLHGDIEHVAPFLDERAKFKGLEVEGEYGFTRLWKPTTWKAAWLRVKTDILMKVGVGRYKVEDNKTGGKRLGSPGELAAKYEKQLELYGISTFLAYPDARVVETGLIMLDLGIVVPGHTYTRDQLPALIEGWEKRITPMMSDTIYAPKPGWYCRWCSYSRTKSGPCKLG